MLTNTQLSAKAIAAVQCQVKLTDALKGNTEDVSEIQIQQRDLRGTEDLPWIQYTVSLDSPTVAAIHGSSWGRRLPKTMEWLGNPPPRVFSGVAAVKSPSGPYELQIIGAERIVGNERKIVLLSTTNIQYVQGNPLLKHQRVALDQPSSCIR